MGGVPLDFHDYTKNINQDFQFSDLHHHQPCLIATFQLPRNFPHASNGITVSILGNGYF